MRRVSEPAENMAKPNNKLITKNNALPIAAKMPSYSTAADEVGYKRSITSLLQELQKNKPRNKVIKKLLAITYDQRRKNINGVLVHVITLIEEFPFSGLKNG